MSKVDEVIPFRAGVNCTFLGKVLGLAGRQFKCGDKGLTVAELEAVRRATALIEAVMVGAVKIEQDRQDNWVTNAE